MPIAPQTLSTPLPLDAVLDDLAARGLLYQCTDEAALRTHLAQPRRLYCGFDPTADSLTIGNLVPIMLLRRFAIFGHQPVVLMGGATGRIGDPSGKDAERRLLTDEQIDSNIAAQKPIFTHLLGESVPIVNNFDWFKSISFLDALRDIGKHFSVNEMIKRDSVRRRLERQDIGISYTEFSYMLLQAYDYLHLFKNDHVTLQCAGSDQWGNIVSGINLIRRHREEELFKDPKEVIEETDETGQPVAESVSYWEQEVEAFGLTAPLLTKADGGKFGKTESGAIWLSATRPSGQPGTSPYAYYQFWLNTADADVRAYLLLFTDLAVNEIDELCKQHEKSPHERHAQRTLAQQATTLLHASDAMQHAQHAAAALFSGDVAHLDLDTLEEVFAEVPATTHSKADLAAAGIPLVDLLVLTSLCTSKREAREHLSKSAISINGSPRTLDDTLTAADLLHGSITLVRRGKKAWHVMRWE